MEQLTGCVGVQCQLPWLLFYHCPLTLFPIELGFNYRRSLLKNVTAVETHRQTTSRSKTSAYHRALPYSIHRHTHICTHKVSGCQDIALEENVVMLTSCTQAALRWGRRRNANVKLCCGESEQNTASIRHLGPCTCEFLGPLCT